MKLRTPQREAIKAAYDAIREGKTRFILAIATGVGKSIVIAKIAKAALDGSWRAVVITNAEVLNIQIAATLEQVSGQDCCIEKAQSFAKPDSSLVSASVQSLYAPGRAESMKLGKTIVFFDEVHMSESDTYKDVLERIGADVYIGLTATAFRADRKPLSFWHDGVIYSYNLRQAINDGFLVPLKGLIRSMGRVRKGDTYNRLADEYRAGMWRTRNVVFVPLIKDARELAKQIGPGADWCSAKRKSPVKKFKDGNLHTIITSTLLVTGFDCCDVNCVIIARNMESLVMLAQAVGRGTRIHPGKNDCLIVDYSGLLVNLSSIMAPDPAIIKKARNLLAPPEMNGEFDILESWEYVEEAIEREEADALQKMLNKRGEQLAILLNPLEASIKIPDFKWTEEDRRVSDTIKGYLMIHGVSSKQIESVSQRAGEKFIEALELRRQMGLANWKLLKRLKGWKYKKCESWTQQEATRAMKDTVDNRYKPVKKYL